MHIEQAYSNFHGFIGWRIRLPSATLLVWQRQDLIPGFKFGTEFECDPGEQIEYSEPTDLMDTVRLDWAESHPVEVMSKIWPDSDEEEIQVTAKLEWHKYNNTTGKVPIAALKYQLRNAIDKLMVNEPTDKVWTWLFGTGRVVNSLCPVCNKTMGNDAVSCTDGFHYHEKCLLSKRPETSRVRP